MRMKFFSLVILSICSFGLLRAQETSTFGTNPTSLKWYQVNTAHFKILYPTGFDVQAQRMANTLEHIYEPEARTLGVKPKKITMLLQNQSSISNGFVTLAPRRSEFYAMPTQNYNLSGTNDWLNMLASHEYRHIVQYQRSITGFNKLFYVIFGQQALAAMSFANTPQWFWEGDAVATETAFTHSGRGRIPNFDLLFRTNLLEGRNFGYHKQYLRSYKHNIPDHYVLGYHMISYLRKKTGDPEIWGKISKRSWSVPFIPFRFSGSIHHASGLYVKQLYNEMAADLKKEWQQQVDELKLTAFDKVNSRPTKVYTDYLYPQVLDEGSIAVLKSGIGDIAQLVLLSESGSERKGYVTGPMNSTGMLSSAGNTVVWNEYRYDPRWQVKTYSVVKGFDLEHRLAKTVSKQSRYGGAALSPDGSKVVTIETDTRYQTSLVVLDYFSGEVIKKIPSPDNDFISMPRFTGDGTHVVALRTSAKGKSIIRFDITTGVGEDLLPARNENIGYPVPHEHYVFYNSPFSGIDNIHVLDTKTGKQFQVTSAKYGAYHAAISKDGKTIYYNEQTRDGMDVVKIPFDTLYWRPLEEVKNNGIGFYEHLMEQEGRPGLLDTIPNQTYTARTYSKLKGLIHPHSWGPYVNTGLTQVQLGVTSQDVLSTTQIKAGYLFDINERSGTWQGSVSYQALYPIIDVTVKQGDRTVDKGDIGYRRITGNDTIRAVDNLTFKWKEKSIEAGLRLPLITTRSKYFSAVTGYLYTGYTSVSQFKNSIDGGGRLLPTNLPQYFFADYIGNGKLIYNHAGISAYSLLKQSRRDINSKWGITGYLDFYNTPYKSSDYNGQQFSFYTVGYIPGFFKHHSIWGYWAYQDSQIDGVSLTTGSGLDNYIFRNGIPLPRGHSLSRFQKFYSLSGNYTLPLWYPDIAIGPLLNIQRMRANVFFDYAYGSSIFFANTRNQRTTSQAYSSTGAEIKFDINVMRFLPQLDVGFRYSYGIQPSVTKFEFLLGTFNF